MLFYQKLAASDASFFWVLEIWSPDTSQTALLEDFHSIIVVYKAHDPKFMVVDDNLDITFFFFLV